MAVGVILTGLCAVCAYRNQVRLGEKQFSKEADNIRQMTVRFSDNASAGEFIPLIRLFYESQTRHAVLDHIALVVGGEIVAAHTVDWEGMDPEFAIGRPPAVAAEALNSQHPVIIERNESLDRLQAWVPFVLSDRQVPTGLYVACGYDSLRSAAAHEAQAVVGTGLLLTLCAALLVYIYCYGMMILPLRRLSHRVQLRGLEADLECAELEEVARFAEAVAKAAQQVIQAEGDKLAAIEFQLADLDERSAVQTELLQCMLKDLRTSMASILGHAELLISSDTRRSEFINLIRGIQREAQRLSRLACQIQDMVRSAQNDTDNNRVRLSIDRLKIVIDKLRDSTAKPIRFRGTGESTRVRLMARNSGVDTDRHGLRAKKEQAATKTRMTGSILVVGRKDEHTALLLEQLHELGLDAEWVPDAVTAEHALTGARYDMIIVNLSKLDCSTLELPAQLQMIMDAEPLVALLPEKARAEAQRFLDAGCSDYLCGPVSRRSLLMVIGKFLEFKPLTQPA